MFIGLLTSPVNGSNPTECISLSNQKCMNKATFINLHPNEYSEELHYYPFTVKLGRRVRSCNTINDLCNKVCTANKTEDLNVHVFNTIKGINESTILTKFVSWEGKCNFDGNKCNSNQNWNNDKCLCECKKDICE